MNIVLTSLGTLMHLMWQTLTKPPQGVLGYWELPPDSMERKTAFCDGPGNILFYALPARTPIALLITQL